MGVKQLLYLAVSILTSSMDYYILRDCIITYIQISVDELTPHKVLHNAMLYTCNDSDPNRNEIGYLLTLLLLFGRVSQLHHSCLVIRLPWQQEWSRDAWWVWSTMYLPHRCFSMDINDKFDNNGSDINTHKSVCVHSCSTHQT